MTGRLHDIPVDQIMTEHYLFDLGQTVEKTAEILDKDEEYVKKIHDDYMRLVTPIRGSR